MASVCWLHVFLLSTAYPTLALAGFWTVHIENGAAPSPEDGPPLSRTASRDRALLPGQICGILGAYVLFVLIVGTAFLTVGRRLRRTAGTSREAPAIEMVKTVTGAFDISPVSPSSSHRTWRAWHSPHSFAFGSKKGNAPSLKSVKSNSDSPAINSILSFDNNVIEADKAKRQDEMERLYAAVMAQEDSKFRVVHSSQEVEIQEDEIRPRSVQQQNGTDTPPVALPFHPAPIAPHRLAPYPAPQEPDTASEIYASPRRGRNTPARTAALTTKRAHH
ncbi:hypothetical protein B0A49_11864 [Cryomyces minteri]|uniref:Uncharacterized protein n=1 Tax=Cryomyces minteri TaxID=331657 RepID=A0A4U0WGA3_9PEZI|nr:hypothetical protein B0A49_11864 [Cryomyces minteri]